MPPFHSSNDQAALAPEAGRGLYDIAHQIGHAAADAVVEARLSVLRRDHQLYRARLAAALAQTGAAAAGWARPA